MDYLSEDTIKRAAIQFLKTYYKFRPRGVGETIVSTDMETKDGIIADGYFSFPKEDGSPFTATLEATAFDVQQEVKYTLQKTRLLWDAVAVGSIVTALVMTLLWAYRYWSLSSLGWLASLILVISILAGAVFIFQQLFRYASRYKYIYAVEQFKRYHADEQWIAIGYDVFKDAEDASLKELKNQCVVNGFGLLQVEKDERLLMLISPAREEIFERHRKSFQFVNHPIAKTLHFDKLNASIIAAPRNFDRFRSPFMGQVMICIASFLVLSGVFYRQWQARPVKYVNEVALRDSLSAKAANMTGETTDDFSDRDPAAAYNSSGSLNVDPRLKTDSAPLAASKEEVGLYVYTNEGYTAYDCSRADIRGVKYIVQDWECNTFDQAKARILKLKQYGLIANCISLKCSANGERGYAVYYEFMYTDFNAANMKGQKIIKELQSLDLPADFIKIRKLHGQ